MPHKGFISIPVDDTLNEVMKRAAEQGIAPAVLIHQILEAYANGTLPTDFFVHSESFFGLLFQFLEDLPLEVTLKTVENDNIVYVWANRRFRAMAGISSQQEILGKTAKDIWPKKRAEIIEKLDREVLTGQPTAKAHFDTVQVGRGTTRMRVGVRFQLTQLFQKHPVLGSIGMDFSSKEAARRAAQTLLLEWGDQLGNNEGRPRSKKKRPEP